MTRDTLKWMTAVAALAGGAQAASASSAIPPPKPEKPAQPAPKPDDAKPEPQPEPGLPGLDDLLGIPSTKKEGEKPSNDVLSEELERALALDPSTDPFQQAVELMSRSANRITQSKDVGLATQRIQEEVIRKLDRLIDQAQKQQQQSSKSKKQQSQQQQQQQQQSSQAQSDAKKGDNTGQTHVPGRQDGPRREGGVPTTAAWGNLPEHVREALLQHYNDRFSSLYQSLTEAYYRKLAEEPKK